MFKLWNFDSYLQLGESTSTSDDKNSDVISEPEESKIDSDDYDSAIDIIDQEKDDDDNDEGSKININLF